jgi:hypothetical protein
LTEVLEHCIVKIFCIVDCDVPGNAIARDDILSEELFDGCGDYVCDRFCLNPLCEVLDYNNGKGELPCAGVNLPTMSMPHHWGGQDGAINCEGYAGTFNRWENFWQASHVASNFVASSITAGH